MTTNSTGASPVIQRYYPFGAIRPGPGNALAIDQTYLGKTQDSTGLIQMGARYYDYIIADDFVIPKAFEKFYSEHVVRLPDTFQANDSSRPIADYRPTRVDCGLPVTGFVFCSFNSTFKITPAIFDIWMRLLLEVEGSVLWLLGGNDAAIRNLRSEAQSRNVAPERLIFAKKLPYPEHLARYQQADLFLDTLPFNAGTTASDALWAGLPVLTCAGDAFAARMAGSLLRAVQLDELVTSSMAEYEGVALRLATLPGVLRAVRERLHNGRAHARLFDTDRFRKNLERAYLQMWTTHQLGERPGGFIVVTEPI